MSPDSQMEVLFSLEFTPIVLFVRTQSDGEWQTDATYFTEIPPLMKVRLMSAADAWFMCRDLLEQLKPPPTDELPF